MEYEVAEIMKTLDEHLTVKDEEGRTVLQVALFATIYFEEPYQREVREAVVSSCEDYLRRCGKHLRWALNPETGYMERFGEGKGSNPCRWLPALSEDKSFTLICHGSEHDRGASAFSMETFGAQRRPYLQMGYLRMSFPLLWFAKCEKSLPGALRDICQGLKPVGGYGGIGVVESPDSSISSKYEPLVYEWSQRFPGLEVDYPISHAQWQCKGREGGKGGIKGVNWLTVVGDKWLAELGGADTVVSDLAVLDSRFIVHRFGDGVLVQAGPHPQLGDAERNVWPELYVKLARYFKPIRITRHRPFQYGGPGPRFDLERSRAWLRRFDDR